MLSSLMVFEPHNPRTTPIKATILNIVFAILGVGVYFAALLGSDNSYTINESTTLFDWKPLVGVVYGRWSPTLSYTRKK